MMEESAVDPEGSVNKRMIPVAGFNWPTAPTSRTQNQRLPSAPSVMLLAEGGTHESVTCWLGLGAKTIDAGLVSIATADALSWFARRQRLSNSSRNSRIGFCLLPLARRWSSSNDSNMGYSGSSRPITTRANYKLFAGMMIMYSLPECFS